MCTKAGISRMWHQQGHHRIHGACKTLSPPRLKIVPSHDTRCPGTHRAPSDVPGALAASLQLRTLPVSNSPHVTARPGAAESHTHWSLPARARTPSTRASGRRLPSAAERAAPRGAEGWGRAGEGGSCASPAGLRRRRRRHTWSVWTASLGDRPGARQGHVVRAPRPELEAGSPTGGR